MDSRSPLTVCLYIQLSVCLLGSSASATTTSLWGKKVQFNGRPCIWQLQPGVVVPALEELSVCLLVRRNFATEWTGFVYKAPGGKRIELGLGGSGSELTVWLFGERVPLLLELKVKEWYSVCLTWSGRARRLRTYINGTLLHEAPVNPNLPQQLAPNGTLTLGVSHNVNTNGEVQPESGNNLLGEIGRFRIWSREWSAEELSGQSCADGDVVRWDQRQWKHGCPPVPDNSLHCAWSLYKIQMWTFVHAMEPGNCVVSPEGVTRGWLESIFPQTISVHDISVSSQSRSCPGVNDSAALHVRQPQGSTASPDSLCDKCFHCEVNVNVNPAANVEAAQTDITSLLSLAFSYNFFNLSADPNSIVVLPVVSFPVVSEPPTAVTTTASTSETGPTQSRPACPANVSTTGDPSDRNLSAFGPDTFFRVNMTLQMNGGPTNPKVIIKKWVKESLEVNGTMIVLNLVIKEKVGRYMDKNNKLTISYQQQKHYYCAFHVQEYKKNSVAEIITFINSALTSKHQNGSIIIEAVDLAIKQILPENCLEETRATIYGEYIWPAAFPQEQQEMVCRKPPSKRAHRLCKLDITTDMTSWARPDMKNCKQLVTMSDLFNITVTTDNAAEVVDIVQDLVDVGLSNSSVLSSLELDSVVRKLNEVVDISVIKPAVGGDIVNVIADILLSETNVTQVATTVLKLTDRMADNMFFSDQSVSVTAPSLALSMVNVAADGFKGLTFGVSSVSSLLDLKTFVNWNFVSEPLPDTDATISLPSELNNCFTRDTTRVQFQFHGTPELFQDTTSTAHSQWTLNSYIVSASINDTDVSNLSDPVVVTLSHHKPKLPDDRVQCMFWDFRKNGGLGGWNGSGCETRSISPHQTSCLCDHLTNFAVLLDVSRTPISEANSYILTLISYLGCGISSIFLGITLLTYLVFEKLRRDHPSKILINLSAALLGLSMLFLLDSWFSSFSSYGLCIATGAMLHYFLLASFTWMGLEAVNMYLALVKVFNIYVPSYILKFCAVGWGIPLVVVGLVLAIDKDAYGNVVAEQAASRDQSTDPFCWLQDDVFFYVTVVAFVLLILLGNIAVFVVVLIQIRRMRANKPSAKSIGSLHDLRAVASLTVLLGLTWSMGFFSFGPGRVVMMYLFSILNTLQGFFIFLFHCVMKENVRKQWRIHLCCGRFRLSDYSDWSRSATVGGGRKNNNLINSGSSDNTSSIRNVSDSSTGSAPSHHQGA
ncbi:adhesion G-protein coupled receptor G4 isoform X1 [Platichthys flesus]|uniref:adhesion G-protein coupled receptor G4 isoform X1 n=1 Tax=Platichthys flesus TaxID=8260 RepID=UPI002DBCEEB2|nr:adhesion G-protein coupled receptor G4 isoform X1 [Platichthys flesus]